MLSGLDDGTEPAGIAFPSDRRLRLISQDAFAKYCMAKASCGSTVEVSPDSIDDGEHHCERPEPIPDYAPTGAAAGHVVVAPVPVVMIHASRGRCAGAGSRGQWFPLSSSSPPLLVPPVVVRTRLS